MLTTWMLVAMVAGLSASEGDTSGWHADYGAALAETKHEAQPLLVVLDDPSDEANRLDPDLLKAESGALPLDSYALCRVDVSTDYGKQVAEGFKVTSFPHVAIIDKSGSVILRRVSGDVSLAEWKRVLSLHAEGDRLGQTRYTVAKQVVDSPVATQPAATPSFSAPTFSSPMNASPRPYCPSCQLRNR
ncbi:hypothetical protein [Botrimarina sp.]|uniref:hypothetical protein n=1 Tax=Botrimarina sp. TaxID=2795802 RepID=UPI0032EF3CEC